MKKIRILYIIDYLSVGGGTENQLRTLIQHLDKDKFEISVVVLKYLDWEGFPGFADPGCPHICLHVSRLLSLDTIRKIFQLASHIRNNNIDIIHTFFFDSNLIGVAAGILGRCRSILISRRDLGFWYTAPKLLLLKLLRRFSHAYIVNSYAIKRAVMHHEKVSDKKITVIYNGFFNYPDNSPSPLSKQRLNIPDNAFVIGIVANLREVKRLDLFIQLAARLKATPSHFLILGNGPLKQSLLEQAKKAGLENRLQILHTLDNIFDYIKLFDIGVLTSSSEGLSNTLIEYQLCGKPAVAFNVGGNDEVIAQDKTGYIIPFGDLDLMAAVLIRLLNNEKQRQELGDNARKQATKLFSGERMTSSFEELYNTQVAR